MKKLISWIKSKISEAERKRMLEEKIELQEYQRKQQQIKEKEIEDRVRHEIKGPDKKRPANGIKSKQQQLLRGVVKRKSSESTSSQGEEKKVKSDNSGAEPEKISSPTKQPSHTLPPVTTSDSAVCVTHHNKPIGLGLLGQYGSGSDSDSES